MAFLRVFVCRTQAIKRAALAFIDANANAYAEKGHPLCVQILSYEELRTLEQNKFYFGVLLAQIADNAWVNGQRYETDAWHDTMSRKFGPFIETPDGHLVPMSTTKMSVGQFDTRIRQVEQYAREVLQIELDLDEKLYKRRKGKKVGDVHEVKS